MGDLYFDGDPERDSTRRRLERVLKEEPARAEPRPSRRWPWKTTLLAGGTAFFWWQLRRRRLRREADRADARNREIPPDER